MEQTSRKRGRPRVPVTDALIEARRLSKQRRNRQQRGGGPRVPDSFPLHGTRPGALPVDRPGPSVETPRQRTYIEKKKREFASTGAVFDVGAQDEVCGFCGALVWAAEFTGRHVSPGPKGYTICCSKGKVHLPLLRPTPPELRQLLTGTGRREVKFRVNSRMYNTVFSMCSFGGTVDERINNGSGPYVFRVNDHVYHSIGSLLPPEGCTPKYAQLYMYDGQEAVEHRLLFPRTRDSLDPDIVTLLLQMLDRDNALVAIFHQLRERYPLTQQLPIRLRLLEKRSSDGRFVNLPGGNDYEFAALAVDQDLGNPRDIIVQYKQAGLVRITELHPCFMSLQYPLLFPHGEDGYRLGIKRWAMHGSAQDNDNTVSMREFQAFRMQFRASEGHTLLLGGRLFLQYVVDAWCCIERSRLKWVERNQSVIRSDLYKNIVDSVSAGDVSAVDVGKRVVLPSSFTGGSRYMQQNFQDSLALCKEYGHPDLFVTFTCNPKWVEIQRSVEAAGCGDASVRPDLVARVFKMKLDSMLSDFMKKDIVGRVRAAVYTIEFQKRGLPHAHIVLWLSEGDKLITSEDIDSIICAEIPDKESDPAGYEAVAQFMMHGPCGEANPRCPCMVNGKCTKYYPKSHTSTTTMDSDGYASYRRRDMGRTVECNKIRLDNR